MRPWICPVRDHERVADHHRGDNNDASSKLPPRTDWGGRRAALASAIQTTVPAGAALAMVDLKVNFLRPARPDGRDLLARGNVVHRGRTMSVANAEVRNADDKPVALATGSAMILEGRPASLAGVAPD
jgi:hypothetical protein